jgi:ABC-type transport system involved in multi-copper enzyme maturation permease subunit
MLASLKSEFRKLFTVRSTYFIGIASLLIVALFAGFGDGFRGSAASLHRPDLLMSESFNAIVFAGLILAFAGLLLVGHEYRYTTIMYTLTNNNRRLKVLLSKFLTVSSFALLSGLLLAFFSPLCTIIGAHLHGNHLGAQHFDYWSVIWRCAFVSWGYAMYAFILIFIMRNQVGSIVTFLLIPLIGESIIGHIFTKSTQYLPFGMLQAVAAPHTLGNHTTSAHAVTVSLTYVAAGLLVGAVLFLKRDAN